MTTPILFFYDGGSSGGGSGKGDSPFIFGSTRLRIKIRTLSSSATRSSSFKVISSVSRTVSNEMASGISSPFSLIPDEVISTSFDRASTAFQNTECNAEKNGGEKEGW